jgi:zinc/manganese transport system substrate-binding protein
MLKARGVAMKIGCMRDRSAWVGMALVAATLPLALSAGIGPAAAQTPPPVINAIGVENEYADIITQIGGKFVKVATIESDPNTDPHEFEANPDIAKQLAGADLVVENGIGYDTWADNMMGANPRKERKVINVQALLKKPDTTPNPHFWFDPKTMPMVAAAIAEDLSARIPAEAATFQANLKTFNDSLKPWTDAIAEFKKEYAGVTVATTEPVADYLLQAAGVKIMTPFSLEKAIMDGTDPSPQDVATENNLFKNHRVKVFVYNQQVTDPLTDSFLQLARKSGIPVVGVYETMPVPGYNYQSWMMAEIKALHEAVANKKSTEKL